MLKGWIAAPYGAKQELLDMGIILGEYDEQQIGFFDCIVSEEAMEKLDPYWGHYWWGLRPIKKATTK